MTAKQPTLNEQLGELLTFQEIFDWLEVSGRTLRYWIAHGNFPKPARRKGRAHLWLKSDVKTWVFEEFDRPADTKTAAPPGTLKRCNRIETRQACDEYNALVKRQKQLPKPNSPLSTDGTLAMNPNIPSARIAFKAPGWQPVQDGKLIPLPADGVAAFFVLVETK